MFILLIFYNTNKTLAQKKANALYWTYTTKTEKSMYSFEQHQNWYDNLCPSDYEDAEEEMTSSCQEAFLPIYKQLYSKSTRFDEDELFESLLTMKKFLNIRDIDIPKDELQVMSKKQHEFETYCRAIDVKQDKEFIGRHVKTLQFELYENEPISTFNIEASISNLAWYCGITEQSSKTNKKLMIERKK